MSKSVVISLGNGDLYRGFDLVTAQLWIAGHPLPEQFIGSLPAAPNLLELYRNWQSMYHSLCACQYLRSQLPEEDDELDIERSGITNISTIDFEDLCQNLETNINIWLSSNEFLNIERKLRSALNREEEIQIIIETSDPRLQLIPWSRWDFFKDYPHAHIALSRSEYTRYPNPPKSKPRANKVRILAILGNSFGINLDEDSKFLKSLQDSEVKFLVRPSREEFNNYLWNSQGWDILFFAGHSQTEGERGRIYINENKINNSLTIEQLEEALKAAIENGLKLAIFNSCDGLGLGNVLEQLNISTAIVMREPVPNRVAQVFFKFFLQFFAQQRNSLYLSVQQASRQLQGLENEFPGASWLPVIFQNPALEPPNWLHLGGIPPCPYRGLFAFQEEDAHLFFGRERFSSYLLKAVKIKPFIAVVGPSGSGKSSVVFAGLIPRLRQDDSIRSQIVAFRPGNNPFEALAVALAPLWFSPQNTSTSLSQQFLKQYATQSEYKSFEGDSFEGDSCEGDSFEGEHENKYSENKRRLLEQELATRLKNETQALCNILKGFVRQNPGVRLILIADQFEELYTLCPESEIQLFLDLLLAAVGIVPNFSLVITLRADFYGHALSYRPFSDALQGAVLNLGPMSQEELRSAIEKPATQIQVKLEPGLVNKLIDDVWGELGNLPLLEFALTQLWEKQKDGRLTHEAYSQIGGVEEALAEYGEQVYSQLSEVDRERAKRIFIQLVCLGEGAHATRRLATRSQVKNWDLVTHLASARLLVTNHNYSTGEETVEIVHEALIKNWRRLEYWIETDGDFRRWQERLRTQIYEWEKNGKTSSALLRDVSLAIAQDWQKKRPEELSLRERDFIWHSQLIWEREKQKKKRRRQLTTLGLTVGLVSALVLAGIARWQWQNSVQNEIKAIAASAKALLKSNQEFDALIAAIEARSQIKYTFGISEETKIIVAELLQQALNFVIENNRLEGHEKEISGMAINPEGNLIATAAWDKTVKIWSRDGQLLQTLKGHKDAVHSVAFSPEGDQIASGSRDGVIKLWSYNGKLLQTIKGHKDQINSLVFSPDGKLIASGSHDTTIKLWSRNGELLQTLNGHKDRVTSLAFSPLGVANQHGLEKLIISGSWDKTVKLWNLDGKLVKTLRGHDEGVSCVTFDPQDSRIATASYDGIVKIWSRDGKELQTLPRSHQSAVFGVVFSPDGKFMVTTSSDKTAKLWNRDGKELITMQGHQNIVSNAVFTPKGDIIATASFDRTVKLWKWKNQYIKILQGHQGVVNSVEFSPVSIATPRGYQKLIATASEDNTVKLWFEGDKTPLQILRGHSKGVNSAVFSPLGVATKEEFGNLIVSASWDNTIKLWRTRDGKLLRTLKGHTQGVNSAVFSPDGKLIASVSWDKTIKIWRTWDGKLLRTLKGHTQGVNSIAFSPNGKLIATGSYDNTLQLWRVETGRRLQVISGHKEGINGVAFSPDGKMIATASWDKTVKIWKAANGEEVQTLRGHKEGVNKVAFSPNGKLIATASWDQTFKLWRTADGKQIQTFNGHLNALNYITFSPDGKTLATASSDKTAILWKLNLKYLDRPSILACKLMGDYLANNPHASPDSRRFCHEVLLESS